MLSIYFGKPFDIPPFSQADIKLSPEQMKTYTGTYHSDKISMNIRVFTDGDVLKGQATGQSSFPLSARDATTLHFDPAGLVMEFDSLTKRYLPAVYAASARWDGGFQPKG